MATNGPKTDLAIASIEKLREEMRTRGNEIQGRLTQLETKMQTIQYIGGLVGTIFASVIALIIIGVIR